MTRLSEATRDKMPLIHSFSKQDQVPGTVLESEESNDGKDRHGLCHGVTQTEMWGKERGRILYWDGLEATLLPLPRELI